MKKIILRSLLIIFILLVAVIAGGLAYLSLALPSIEAPEMTVEITPERVERGEYLAHHVALCMDCHSERDWSKFSAPPKPGTIGVGGDVFNREMGMPGVFYAGNITPGGVVGDYTDGELYRAITSGVAKDGRALFPIMPYLHYGRMDKEDILSIIAYVRTLEPSGAEWPEREIDFPLSLIVNTIPKMPEHQPIPPKSDRVAYGKYLAMACIDCHSPNEGGKPNFDLAFAGGFAFALPTGGVVTSSNITPDRETGIGNWTEEQFIEKFKTYADSSYVPHEIKPNEFNSVMPWVMIAGMDEGDLSAIYAYLQTLDPISNKIEKFVTDPVE